MNNRFVIYSLGKLLEVLSLLLLAFMAFALWETDAIGVAEELLNRVVGGFALGAVVSGALGVCMILLTRNSPGQGGTREGFAIVTFAWILFTMLGGMPLFLYLLAGEESITAASIFGCFTDACFEAMSGFTTTGATILTDIEVVPHSILLWRSMTHWLGGMGIVTLALIVFPAFGVAGYQMFRGETPGPSKERLTPRVGQTAMVLWGLYVGLTILLVVLLRVGGMSFFESLCHAFATMATGGFSTRNASVGGFGSAYIEWVIIAFMFLAGMNFIIHFHFFLGRDPGIVVRDRELRFYAGIVLVSTAIITTALLVSGVTSTEQAARSYRHAPLSHEALDAKLTTEQGRLSSMHGTVRAAAFQVVSVITTTGFCSADFDVWPDIARYLLVVLMFFGGCAGSTGGGIKVIRLLVMLKAAWREVRTTVQPRLILPVKVGTDALVEKQVMSILSFFAIFLTLFAVFSGVLSLMVPDLTTAVTAVASCICNVGPGLSGVGAAETYAWIPIPGKWVLILCMLLGRLEIYTVLIALAPASWRK